MQIIHGHANAYQKKELYILVWECQMVAVVLSFFVYLPGVHRSLFANYSATVCWWVVIYSPNVLDSRISKIFLTGLIAASLQTSLRSDPE